VAQRWPAPSLYVSHLGRGAADSIAEVLAFCRAGHSAAVRVEPEALPALGGLIAAYKDRFEEAVIRRMWREKRYAEDPRCDFCGDVFPFARTTVDHRVPKCEGGTESPENFLLACDLCNQRKGKLSVRQFYERLVSASAFAGLAPVA